MHFLVSLLPRRKDVLNLQLRENFYFCPYKYWNHFFHRFQWWRIPSWQFNIVFLMYTIAVKKNCSLRQLKLTCSWFFQQNEFKSTRVDLHIAHSIAIGQSRSLLIFSCFYHSLYIWLESTSCFSARHYKISRIRGFYMRKIKYTQQNYHDKLTQIITDFPRLEVIVHWIINFNCSQLLRWSWGNQWLQF